jgi:ribosomal-protein-alanine N-acetyltransferase
MLNLDAVFESFPALETERLTLRAIQQEDAPEIFAIFSDVEVMRYYDMAPFETPVEAQTLIAVFEGGFADRKYLRWGITLKEGGDTVIGTCGFNDFRPHNASAIIGYDLAQAVWGHGCATEAVSAMLKFGFEQVGLNRIEAMTMLWNVASMRLLDRLGFTEEGILRQYGHWRGDFHDLRMYALLKHEYARQDAE